MANKLFADLIDDTANRLKTLGEEMRVKAQLASMDARDKWEELRPELDTIETQLHDGVQAPVSRRAAAACRVTRF